MSLLWDTSAIVAYYYSNDIFHRAASDFMNEVKKKRIYKRFYITDCILDESLTFFECVVKNHGLAEEVGDALLESNFVTIEPVDGELLRESWDLFRHRRGLSFTDCTSFSLMRRIELTKAFTFDGHFKEEGFEALP
ncbi:MAG: PIN domain-containing protein [Candidatus Bathyarchaeota archaeon]|nr:PIN domain-containing protein [Candidatus Bathyarchaeota archaeon]